jgi:DNA-binding transcriptional LysR family regulator
MNITMRQLQIFQAVAQHRSYTAAATYLHLTQPAVFMQVKQLEESVGLPVFETIGKRLYLTGAGQELLRYSQIFSQQFEEMREVFANLQGIERGTLSLSTSGTAIPFTSQLLAAFFRDHPAISLNIDIANRAGLLDHLEANEVDLVIMGKPPDKMDLESEGFMANPLVVIAPPDHPLARRKKTPLAQLMEHEFVVRERGSGTRNAMERFFSAHRVELMASIETASNDSIKHAVAAGLGLGILSIHMIELELAAKRLAVLDVEHFPIMRHWYVVYRKGKRLSPVARMFKDFVVEQTEQIWPLRHLCKMAGFKAAQIPKGNIESFP